MTQMRDLLEESGMSTVDFCYAIGERKKRVIEFVRGENEPPAVVISKAMQVLADLNYWNAFFAANPDKITSYKIFKYVLDDGVKNDYED